MILLTFFRWWPCGTELQKYCLDPATTLPLLMCGQLDVYLLRWLTNEHYFLGTLRLMSYLRFSGEQLPINIFIINFHWEFSCIHMYGRMTACAMNKYYIMHVNRLSICQNRSMWLDKVAPDFYEICASKMTRLSTFLFCFKLVYFDIFVIHILHTCSPFFMLEWIMVVYIVAFC